MQANIFCERQGPIAAANDVKGLVAAVVGSQSWCPLRARQRNLSRGSVPQDVPPSLLATVATVLRNQSHVQQGDHHKNKVCSARIGQLHLVLALSCIPQDHDYNVVGLLLSCLELRQVLTTAMGATPLQGMSMSGVLCDMARNK